MNEHDDSPFKIRLDEEDTLEDSMYDEKPDGKPGKRSVERPDRKFDDTSEEGLKKLNRRVTILAVVIPVITIIMLAFVYMNIDKKVFDISNKGDNRVQDISNSLESSLSAESSKLKEMLDTETLDMKNKSNSLAKKIDANVAVLKKLSRETAALTKAGQETKAVEKSVSDMNKKMAAVEADLKKAKAEIEAFHAEAVEKIAKLDDMMGNTFEVLQKLKTDMVLLKENQNDQVDQQALKSALDKQQKEYRQGLQEIKNELSGKINNLKKSGSSIKAPPVQKPVEERGIETNTLEEQDISG
jgi:DNA repair exonuclease SbcCD ATPase subunit